MEQDLATLAERVNQLERRAGWQRFTLAAVLVAAAGVVAAGFASPQDERVVVRELSVADGEGRVRLTLWAEDDEAGVKLFDQAGVQRAQLLGGDKESILTFFDERGEGRTVLTQGFNDHGLYLQAADGHDRVSLVATSEDEGLFFPGGRGLYVVREQTAESLRLVTER